MKYNRGDLVLVQKQWGKEPKEYAIVQNQTFNAIKVKFMQTGKVMVYLKRFVTPVTAESK